ncbi:MAG: hypothetical protein E7637_05240 [Ruminococcaceae bacterium]|nr:hypothetical protein [Oscillospiraceae bacterium]
MFDAFLYSSATDLSLWEKIAEWYQGSLIHELLNYFQENLFTIDFWLYENFSIDATTAKTISAIIPALAIALVLASFMTARLRVNMGRFVRRLLKKECLSPESAKTLLELDMFRNAALRRELCKGSSLRMVVRCLHADGTDTGVGIYQDMPLSRMLEGVLDDDAKPTTSKKRRKKNADNKEQSVESADGEAPVAAADAAVSDTVQVTDATVSAATQKTDKSPENAHTVSKKTRYATKKVDFLTARFYIPEPLKHRADVRFDSRGSSWAPAIASIVLVIALSAFLCWALPYVLWLADAIISLAAPK